MIGISSHAVLLGYRFLFSWGKLKAGFHKISGLGGSIQTEYIYEGGCMDCAYPIISSKGSTGKITFEKGFGYYNPFYGSGGYSAGMRISAPCSIIVMGQDGKPKRTFAFDYGIILSWECSALDAGSGELLIDKVEIEHTGLREESV